MRSETKKDKIICIGNRLIPEDSLAMEVYDLLTGSEPYSPLSLSEQLHDNIEIIEGGIAGLNLLSHLENAGNIVFVDTVSGFLPPEKGCSCEISPSSASSADIVVLTQQEITSCLQTDDFHYGHHSGIAYLLSILPVVCEGSLPESVFLVGLEGRCGHEVIERAACLTIQIAMTGNNYIAESHLHASVS